jgi:hypothetical protein
MPTGQGSGVQTALHGGGVEPMAYGFSIPSVQGGCVRQQSSAGNIRHFGRAERCGRDEASRLDTPG